MVTQTKSQQRPDGYGMAMEVVGPAEDGSFRVTPSVKGPDVEVAGAVMARFYGLLAQAGYEEMPPLAAPAPKPCRGCGDGSR